LQVNWRCWLLLLLLNVLLLPQWLPLLSYILLLQGLTAARFVRQPAIIPITSALWPFVFPFLILQQPIQ
jgi:hypothetical protein